MATTLGQLQGLVNQQGNQVTGLVKSQGAAYQAMLDRQNAQQQGLFGQYTSAVNKQTPLNTVYKNLMQSTGVNDANTALQGYKDQTYRVQGLLNNLVPDINSRTEGTLTTQAMRDRMASSEGGDLTNQIQGLGLAMQPYSDIVSSGMQSINSQLPLIEQDYSRQLQPLQLKISSIGDQFARQISGFTSNQQNTLNALMDKLNKQWTLSEQDWQQAQTAAAQAASYNQYLQQTAAASAPASPLKALPSLPTLNLQGGGNGLVLQGGNGLVLQGGNSPVLQGGSGMSLQGGSGFRLQ